MLGYDLLQCLKDLKGAQSQSDLSTQLQDGSNGLIDEYQYATRSAYSTTMSELPLKEGELNLQISPSHHTNVD